jgi:hypothetical protein
MMRDRKKMQVQGNIIGRPHWMLAVTENFDI